MNADRIASSYRWLEYAAFGTALENARFDFLSRTADARRVLILGEGDGRFLARLLRSNPHANVAVIETSGRMIDLARQRLTPPDRLRVDFHNIDAVTDSLPTGPFDVAVTHFFLDVLRGTEAERCIAKVSAELAPGAFWLVSEFHEPSQKLQGMHARLWLGAMYAFFAATTGLQASELPPYRNLLRHAGLAEIAYKERGFGLIRSQIWRRV